MNLPLASVCLGRFAFGDAGGDKNLDCKIVCRAKCLSIQLMGAGIALICCDLDISEHHGFKLIQIPRQVYFTGKETAWASATFEHTPR